jgi:hypothetical protein
VSSPAYEIAPMEQRMLFVIGPPRSGSTLLMRMLSSHSQIYSRAEPHLLTPLAHLGYFDTVDAAPFDHLQAAQAAREFVADLPRGEQDYLDACRAYTDILYGRMLAARGRGKVFFLDKTPANGLILPFLSRLYPKARYIVLTRHPAAIFSSYAHSFFDGDYAAAQRFNPILRRYVPAMAQFLRQRAVPLLQVGYEQLVLDPETEMRRVFEFVGVAFEAEAIEYGKHSHESKGLGDPVTVNRQTRPVTDSVDRWAEELAQDPAKLRLMVEMLDELSDEDLATWGFPRAGLFDAVERARQSKAAAAPRSLPLDRFRVQRKVLRVARQIVHRHPRLEKLVRQVRLLCDVVLRG